MQGLLNCKVPHPVLNTAEELLVAPSLIANIFMLPSAKQDQSYINIRFQILSNDFSDFSNEIEPVFSHRASVQIKTGT